MDNAFRDYHVVSFWSDQSTKNYAAPKARRDIAKIIKQVGVTVIPVNEHQLETLDSRLEQERSIASRANKKLATFVQYPLKPLFNISDARTREAFDFVRKIDSVSDRKIVFVHDIKSLQADIFEKKINVTHFEALTKFENYLFTWADRLIVHSEPMAAYIAAQFHVDPKQLIPLGMFDYLGMPVTATQPTMDSIAFAGYLGPAKKTLVEKLFVHLPKRSHGAYNLYGPDFMSPDSSRSDIAYRGSVDSDELPDVLNQENKFGLLWDNLDEKQRFYYRMISPHKCSLYAKAFLPLIVPSDTYIERVVRELMVGIVINSLSDLQNISEATSHIDFASLKKLKEKVETGHFTRTALEKALA